MLWLRYTLAPHHYGAAHAENKNPVTYQQNSNSQVTNQQQSQSTDNLLLYMSVGLIGM